MEETLEEELTADQVIKQRLAGAEDIAANRPRQLKPRRTAINYAGWRRPPEKFYKLNTDGWGSLGNNHGPARCGGLIRNHFGEWVCGFSWNLGIANTLSAQLLGLRQGLAMARELGIKNLLVEIRSHDAITALLLDSSHHGAPLISDCRSLLRQLGVSSLRRVRLEDNQCAELLADEGGNQPRITAVIHRFPPLNLLPQLYADAWFTNNNCPKLQCNL